jgi:predicted nucleic acid-binding protein
LYAQIVPAGQPRALQQLRPEHRLAHGLTREAVDEFLAELAALIESVELHLQWRPQGRDPNDEMVFEAAINGQADVLVTYNVADFRGIAERFRTAEEK